VIGAATRTDAETVAPSIRSTMLEIGDGLAVRDLESMEDVVTGALAAEWALAALLAACAAAAVVLAALELLRAKTYPLIHTSLPNPRE
jgi:hypothetical protein